MRKRNFRIAVFGATYAMALLMMPSKVSVHAATNEFTPEEMVVQSGTLTEYHEQTLRAIASEVFDTYTSSAEKRNAEDPLVLAEMEKYKNIGIANVEDHLNIRAEANENAEVVGTLAKNAGCTIESIDENGWAKITSGDVTGYVMSNYLFQGDVIPSLVEQVGTKMATVDTETVRLRGTKSTEGITLDLLCMNQEVEVLDDSDPTWVEVKYKGDKGFIAKEFVEIEYKLAEATPVVKEEAPVVNETTSNTTSSNTTVKKPATNSSSSNKTTSNKTTSNKTTSSSSSSSTSSVRSNIVSYAKQFVGGKYVFGGTSLTSGVDCSGFTMKVYEKFGYSITRTSRSQASAGKTISVSSVKPGDLLFYSKSGSINHVAMYIGGGRVVHASNPTDGIKISNMNYRTPCKAVRFIND